MMSARSSKCRAAFAMDFPLWPPWRRWNASSARLNWRLRVALSRAIQWHMMEKYPHQLLSDHTLAVKLIWPAASWKKSSVICDSKNWLVTPTVRLDFRVINHDFHAVTMALWSFVWCGMSFSSRSSHSKRSRLWNSQHSTTLIDWK